jgi:uncharacterized protein
MFDPGGMIQLATAVASGTLIGFSLGLIGGGGSILATPLLLYVVGMKDIHTAVGTGALAVSFNAYANLASHALKGNVWWRCAAIFACVGALAAFAGSTVGKFIDGRVLLTGFALIMLLVSVMMVRPLRPARIVEAASLDVAAYGKLFAIAAASGFCSGLFGIGGGFLIVPGLMISVGMPMINAVGSSLLAVGTFGLSSATNYARSGMVDWLVAGEFLAGGVVGGVLGMSLCTRMATRQAVLKRGFSAVVFLTALYMLLSRH